MRVVFRRPWALSAIAAALAALPGCSSVKCEPIGVFAVADGGACVGTQQFFPQVQACFDEDQPQGHGLKTLCLFDGQGRFFLGVGGSTSWVDAPGWTHSDWFGPGTLTSEQVATCASVDPDLLLPPRQCADE